MSLSGGALAWTLNHPPLIHNSSMYVLWHGWVLSLYPSSHLSISILIILRITTGWTTGFHLGSSAFCQYSIISSLTLGLRRFGLGSNFIVILTMPSVHQHILMQQTTNSHYVTSYKPCIFYYSWVWNHLFRAFGNII